MRRHPTAMHKQCIQIRGLTFICGPSKKKFNKEKNCVEDVNRELFKQNDKYIYGFVNFCTVLLFSAFQK